MPAVPGQAAGELVAILTGVDRDQGLTDAALAAAARSGFHSMILGAFPGAAAGALIG